MRKLPTFDIRLIPMLLGVVLVAAVIAQILAPPQVPSLSVRSADADGAMVLRLWLEGNGYKVSELLTKPLQPTNVRAMFVLNPLIEYTDAEAERIQAWVRRGNTLIVTGAPFIVNDLLDPYDVRLIYRGGSALEISPAAPTLKSPSFNSLRVNTIYGIDTDRKDVVPHLSGSTYPVVVSFPEGSGTVWVFATERPFTNLGLSDKAGNGPQLLMNVLAGIPAKSAIGFDEAHHGFGELMSVPVWLFQTAPGWGILLTLILTMIYLTMQGRRFGRPLPLPDNRLRREPVEYIQAIANLFRRSGQRTEILAHYRHQLRQRISQRYALDSSLSDTEWVKVLVYREPTVDESRLRDLLKRLSAKKISEPELVAAAADVDTWLRSLST